MNTPPQRSFTRHPLVVRYLDELERLLHGVDPVERTEVLDGVREHLEASLHGSAGGDADVRAALEDIGPPQAVADEAYVGRPSGPVAAQAPVHTAPATVAPPHVPTTSRSWVPPIVWILGALSLLQVVTTALIGPGSLGLSDVPTVATDGAVMGPGALSPSAAETAVLALGFVWPLWLPLAVLVTISNLWRAQEKALLVAVSPAAMLLLIAVPLVARESLDRDTALTLSRLVLAVVAIGGVLVLTKLVNRGARRGPAPDSTRPWLPISVAVLQTVGLVLVLAVTSDANTLSSQERAARGRDGSVAGLVGRTTFDAEPGTGLVAMLAALPAWIPLVILVTGTVLWTRRERLALTLVIPGAALVFGTLPTVGWVAAGEVGVYVVGWVGLLGGVVGGFIVTAVLGARALRRGAALRSRRSAPQPS